MEIVPFDRVVSVTGELQGHPAKNIIHGEISPNKNWLCEKGSAKAAIILQLKRAAVLTSIHVGNAHSAFVEILVGKAADGTDQFVSFVPVSVFMSPHDSTTGNNRNRTRFFNKSDFSPAAVGQAWDRLKIVCSQPFNKHVPFGLCFVQVQGEREEPAPAAAALASGPSSQLPASRQSLPADLVGKTSMDPGKEDEIQIGSFFKKKRSSGGAVAPSGDPSGNESAAKGPEVKSPVPKPAVQVKPTASPSTTRESQGSSARGRPSKGGTLTRKDDTVKGRDIKVEKSPLSSKDTRKPDVEDKRKEGKPGKEKRLRRGKPFGQLLEGVVFVISGFQNPLRGDIRSLGLEMGAKYSPDWDSRCTHLVCACANTPKFNQVKGKGKIVKKEWLERCHADRKRYPWRRFALDRKDSKQPESEEEVEEEVEATPEPERQEPPDDPPDPVPTTSKRKRVDSSSESVRKSPGVDEYNVSTDEDGEGDGDDNDNSGIPDRKGKVVDTAEYPMPFLPDFLSSKVFYVDPNLQERRTIERYVVAYSGSLALNFDEDVEFYITDRGGPLLTVIKKKVPNVVAVKPSWLSEMNSKQKFTSATPHLVK